jgi:hypothetical protein
MPPSRLAVLQPHDLGLSRRKLRLQTFNFGRSLACQNGPITQTALVSQPLQYVFCLRHYGFAACFCAIWRVTLDRVIQKRQGEFPPPALAELSIAVADAGLPILPGSQVYFCLFQVPQILILVFLYAPHARDQVGGDSNRN